MSYNELFEDALVKYPIKLWKRFTTATGIGYIDKNNDLRNAYMDGLRRGYEQGRQDEADEHWCDDN